LKVTKVLILNVGSTNKGNQAIVASTIEAIRRFVPEAQFIFMGQNKVDTPEVQIKELAARAAFGQQRKPFRLLVSLLYLAECISIYGLRKLGAHVPVSRRSKLFDYCNCGLVVNSGGDILSGEGSFGLTSFLNILYAVLLDKPVVLYGESLGYFSNSIFNAFAKFVINRTSLILLREELSKEYLDKEGITKPRIYVTAEPAFLLPAIPRERVHSILSDEHISEAKRPLIGINPSGKIMKDGTGIEAFARTIDDLAENLNATMLMIPHVFTEGVDDRVVIDRIFREIRNKSSVMIVSKEHTAQELKGIIGQCDLFVGARMHATVAATSMLVPTVGIAYSHKMHGIIGKMLGQEGYILDIQDLSYEGLKSKIYEAWQNREAIRAELALRVPPLKEKALLNGKLVKELVVDSLTTG
jgi:colanic acid/amylovoran biosynthesis protein